MSTVEEEYVEAKCGEKKVSAAEKYEFFDLDIQDETVVSKRVNVVLSPDTANRLHTIQSKIKPSTQTEAISKSLHLLETLLTARENGTKIYLKNKDSDDLVEFRMGVTA